MALPRYLLGLLNAQTLAGWLKREPIQLKVEAKGKKISVRANSRKELNFCVSHVLGLANFRTQKLGVKYGIGNDRVSEVDQLGFERYVSAFVDLIESPYTKPPLTIGIFGSWGMGKSFLLEHIGKQLRKRYKERLEGNMIFLAPRVHIVNFNAWEYSSAELIWPSLVRKIMDQLEAEVSWGFPGRFITKLTRNLKHQLKESQGQIIVIILILAGLAIYALQKFSFDVKVLWGASLALGVGGLLKIVADTLSKPISSWFTTLFKKSSYGKEISHMADIRADLEILVNLLVKNNERVLIVIDDLDRCDPRKAVEVLQAINLLLNFDSFIICLGIDARIITCAVEEYYKNLLGSAGASGYEYLDKIVQIPFCIPQPTSSQISHFLDSYLALDIKKDQISSRITLKQTLLQIVGSFKESFLLIFEELYYYARLLLGRQISLEFEQDEFSYKVSARSRKELIKGTETALEFLMKADHNIAFTTEEIEAFQAFSHFLRPNPRHLKRLVNVYRLVRTLAEYESDDVILRNSVVAIHWLIMCGQWPYTANLMLQYFDNIIEQQKDGLIDLPQVDNSLIYLLEKVSPQILKDKQMRIDYDPDLLVKFLQAQKTCLKWEELEKIRQYTVNFNPAIESIT
jgi:Cdc6-like AAA superfamily ATPase